MEISVFAVDPGTTTGWACASGFEHRLTPDEWPWVTGQLMGDEHQQAWDLAHMIKLLQPCAVVIEDFIPRQLNQARWFLSPVRVTAALTMLLWLEKIRWQTQQPSLALRTVNDEYLKDNGLWVKGQQHAMDATRHAITFVRRVAQEPRIYGVLTSPRGLE